MFRFFLISAIFLFEGSLWCVNYTDFSYFLNKKEYERYSINYLTSISTYFFAGTGYEYYENKEIGESILKLMASFVRKNFVFSFKPVYFLKEKQTYAYGLKTGINFGWGKDDFYKNAVFNLNFLNRNGKIDHSDTVGEVGVELNFDGHIFLSARVSCNFTPTPLISPVDYSSIIGYSYLGYIGYTVYSDVGFGYARSFKPDFNSYLYFSFDRINGYMDDLNSYLIGFKTYLDDEEKYFMDFGYNLADFKKNDNENYYRIMIGVSF
jgi:hypothetical protein